MGEDSGAEQCSDGSGREPVGHLLDEVFRFGSGLHDDETGVGTHLARPHQTARGELFGDGGDSFLQRTRQQIDRVDARQFQIDRLADAIGRFLKLHPGGTRSRVTDRTDEWVRGESFAVVVTRAIDELNETVRHSGLGRRQLSLFRQQSRRAGMR